MSKTYSTYYVKEINADVLPHSWCSKRTLDWVSGGWGTFQYTTVLTLLNYDAYLHIHRTYGSFCRQLHGITLLDLQIQKKVVHVTLDQTYFLTRS